MTGPARRIKALTAMVPFVAVLALAMAPMASAGISVGATITVQKVTNPASDLQDFDFDLTGAGAPSDMDLDTDSGDATLDSQSTFNVSAAQLGAYTITETAVTGWTLTNVTCTGDAGVQYTSTGATLGVNGGESILCTFTNVKSATLTVTKVTVPAEDAQDFYLDLASIFNTTLDTDPTSAGVPNTDSTTIPSASLGSHTLHETAVSGWTLTDVDCTGDPGVQYDSDGATLDIDAGETIDCTFTNTKDGQPTADNGGETDAASPPDTYTTGPGSTGSGESGLWLLVGALGVLSAVLVVTRPRRVRE